MLYNTKSNKQKAACGHFNLLVYKKNVNTTLALFLFFEIYHLKITYGGFRLKTPNILSYFYVLIKLYYFSEYAFQIVLIGDRGVGKTWLQW